MNAIKSKRERGQFFTTTNPFDHRAVRVWMNQVPAGVVWLEPFAGANNLVLMIEDIGELRGGAASYDLEPQSHDVARRDTLADFPTGHVAGITNPPYLAKNSATRRGLKASMGDYDDLYKHCIAVCLDNLDYLAAIIPESFITSGLFRSRLQSVVSLTFPMFDDTETPVCLALWGPEPSNDFIVWRGPKKLGSYMTLTASVPCGTKDRLECSFNDPNGVVGLKALDSTEGATIQFCLGREIAKDVVKSTSRSVTRISIRRQVKSADLVRRANEILRTFREDTSDILLTSFKGLRKDGVYRRRLDWALARSILNLAYEDVANER